MNREQRRNLIRQYGKKIVQLESLCQQGINVEENQKKISELSSQLTLEEMLALDEYVISHIDK